MNISKIEWNGYRAVAMEAGGWEALLIPELGANLVKLVHREKKLNILRTPKDDELEFFAARPQLFGLPLLFPPNRIEDGTYTHNGKTYHYPITIPDQNNHHHGTLKSQAFTVTRTEIGSDYVEVEASFFSNLVNDAVYSYFPHAFECRMSFKLSACGLEHRVTFVNQSDSDMPLGVGYHTPIMIPFVEGGNADQYKLRMSVGEKWEVNDRTLPTGKRFPLDQTEQQLRTCGLKPTGCAIEWPMTGQPIEVDGKPYNGAIIEDSANGVTVYYQVDDQFKHWTFWNNGGTVDWACPEPQTWAINAPNLDLPNEVTGFQTVAPGQSWSAVSKIYAR
ncbi:MAG: aldose 1-epimerase [Rikenellaceae bacterium]|nr:aldose 1-epimerase [Rikenellaceae bacterium]